jgi:hypothetical protein
MLDSGCGEQRLNQVAQRARQQSTEYNSNEGEQHTNHSLTKTQSGE